MNSKETKSWRKNCLREGRRRQSWRREGWKKRCSCKSGSWPRLHIRFTYSGEVQWCERLYQSHQNLGCGTQTSVFIKISSAQISLTPMCSQGWQLLSGEFLSFGKMCSKMFQNTVLKHAETMLLLWNSRESCFQMLVSLWFSQWYFLLNLMVFHKRGAER